MCFYVLEPISKKCLQFLIVFYEKIFQWSLPFLPKIKLVCPIVVVSNYF